MRIRGVDRPNGGTCQHFQIRDFASGRILEQMNRADLLQALRGESPLVRAIKRRLRREGINSVAEARTYLADLTLQDQELENEDDA